jgi:IS30 family transposase
MFLDLSACSKSPPRLRTWQRGTNENTNRLLRQYFPQRTDLSGYTRAELDKVALRLNQRPRKTLGFETPATRLRAGVATTH